MTMTFWTVLPWLLVAFMLGGVVGTHWMFRVAKPVLERYESVCRSFHESLRVSGGLIAKLMVMRGIEPEPKDGE